MKKALKQRTENSPNYRNWKYSTPLNNQPILKILVFYCRVFKALSNNAIHFQIDGVWNFCPHTYSNCEYPIAVVTKACLHTLFWCKILVIWLENGSFDSWKRNKIKCIIMIIMPLKLQPAAKLAEVCTFPAGHYSTIP